jgi:DNA-binding NtrC family response regulator
MSDLLLIDDDPGQLVTQVRRAFPAPGPRVAVARTGAEGVARVRAAPPDVVLLNLGLPHQDGLQDLPATITGESGTNQEIFARAIHQHSSRASRGFLALNVAAIPEADIRELQRVLKQALLRASGTILLPAFPPEPLGGPGERAPAITPREAPGLESFIRGRLGPDARDLYAETHRQVDRLLLPRVLDYTRGSQNKAASLLGIARQTLRQKLREQGLGISSAG